MALSYKIVFHKAVMDMSNGARWPCHFSALIPGSISRRIESVATKIAAFWHWSILVPLLLTGTRISPEERPRLPQFRFSETSLDDCKMSHSKPRIQLRTWAWGAQTAIPQRWQDFLTNDEQLHEGSSRPARLATANI